MKKKIIKVGNSLAITLPVDFVKKVGLQAGNEVSIEVNPEAGMLLLKDKSKDNTASLSPEFFEWLEATSKENKELIKELAKI
jgi:antitoxin component of MazEF toxin-antitoxin module